MAWNRFGRQKFCRLNEWPLTEIINGPNRLSRSALHCDLPTAEAGFCADRMRNFWPFLFMNTNNTSHLSGGIWLGQKSYLHVETTREIRERLMKNADTRRVKGQNRRHSGRNSKWAQMFPDSQLFIDQRQRLSGFPCCCKHWLTGEASAFLHC